MSLERTQPILNELDKSTHVEDQLELSKMVLPVQNTT